MRSLPVAALVAALAVAPVATVAASGPTVASSSATSSAAEPARTFEPTVAGARPWEATGATLRAADASTRRPVHGAELGLSAHAAASRTVHALGTGTAADEATLPTDFDAVMGYRAVVLDNALADPTGACSSPVTLPIEFESACKTHDLGYDVLRYADRTGRPLGAWARKSLDTQLDRRLHAACDTRVEAARRAGCHIMADIAAGVVQGNSWRQHYAPPRGESAAPYALGAFGFAVVVGAVTAARRWARGVR